MSQPNALEIKGKLYSAGMAPTTENPFGTMSDVSNERDNKDLNQKETVEKATILDNGQPVDLLPRGVDDFGLNFLAPGPVYVSNEPDRTLRPGGQLRIEHSEQDGTSFEKQVNTVEPTDGPPIELIKDPIEKRMAQLNMLKIPEDRIHQILLSEFGDEYKNTLYAGTIDPTMAICVLCGQRFYEHDAKIGHGFKAYRPSNPLNLEEGMKQGTEIPMKSDTGDQDWLRRDALQLDSSWEHKYYPIEPQNEFPTVIGWINYEPSVYNRQNANNQPDKHPGLDISADDTPDILTPEYLKPLKLADSNIELIPADHFEVRKLKLRSMRKYIYKNKGITTPYDERKKGHICAMLADSVWESEDPTRPVLPSEGVGLTNTHPNCQCTWEIYTIIDDNEQHFDKVLRPTRNGKPLEAFAWKGQALQKLSDTDANIEAKISSGQKLGPVYTRKLETLKAVQEAVAEIRHEFKWLSDDYVSKLRKAPVKGKFLLVRAVQATLTDHRKDTRVHEDYRRHITAQEIERFIRTAIGKHADINHDTPMKMTPDGEWPTTVVDADFDDSTKAGQMLVYEEDQEILKLIRQGKIDAVSINGGPPREEPIVCKDATCSERVLEPRGIILGEGDDIAFTYVVTARDGIYYDGRHISAASPGVKTTAIEIIE